MTTLREAAQQALEVLEDVPYMSNKDDYARLEQVITALRAALAEPVQEPVAWMDSDGFPWSKEGREMRSTPDTYTPLYTHPAPQRQEQDEPAAWTTPLEINWAQRNPGRAGSFYAAKEGPNDIPLYLHTAPQRPPLRTVTYVCPVCAASLERQE